MKSPVGAIVLAVLALIWLSESRLLADVSAKSAAGFYRVAEDEGTWWVVDPSGEQLLSRGVNVVHYDGDHSPLLGYAPYGRAVQQKYGSRAAWAEAAARRLRDWGFNTIGSWSDEAMYSSGLAYTQNLNIARSVPDKPVFPDVFSDTFASTADRVAAEQCAARRDDPALLGYYLDNELHWGESWHSDRGLLALYLALPDGAPGRTAALDHLRSTFTTIELLNEALGSNLESWNELSLVANLRALGPQIEVAQRAIQAAFFERLVGSGAITREALVEGSKRMAGGSIEALNQRRGTNYDSFEAAFAVLPMTPTAEALQRVERAFSGRVADQYFRVATEAIRRHDPNHMILGVRFGGVVFEAVARAMAPYVDVASMNQYRTLPGPGIFELHEWSGRPVLITEFSFKATDAGVPSDTSAGIALPTQRDRADAFEHYVSALAAIPHVVGYHWFQHHDQPATGRFDGENNNFGLVSNDDTPWQPLVERVTEVNARVEEIHRVGAEPSGGSPQQLFNGRDLAGWDRYLGVPEVPTVPFDLFGRWPAPLGRNHDPADVFSVVMEDGQPAIRISGEIWGALISQQEYENYHLSLEYKWGEKRYPPRADAPRNTGLLYHSIGPDGAFWSYWMRSAEFEIMEGRTGDLTSVDGVEAVASTQWDSSAGYPWRRYATQGSSTDVGGLIFRVAARGDFEKPVGQWNRLELIVHGDQAEHRVNGETVLAVRELRHEADGKIVPLTRGAIQLQSEGAEVFFRSIELRSIESM